MAEWLSYHASGGAAAESFLKLNLLLNVRLAAPNMPSSKPSPQFPTFCYLCSWRFLRVVAFALVSLATVVALFYAEENIRGKRAWNSYKRERAAKGEKLSLADFIPPPVPEEQNLALCPLLKPLLDLDLRPVTEGKITRWVRGPQLFRDTNGLKRLDQWNRTWSVVQYRQTSPREKKFSTPQGLRTPEPEKLTNGWIDLAGWAAYYRTGTNLAGVIESTPSATAVLLALHPLEGDLRELQREAILRPFARWPVYYDTNHPWGILLPQLAREVSIVSLLQLRASARLAAGETEEGFADIELAFRIAESSRDEPILISQLVRNKCHRLISQPFKEGLARHQFSDAQLDELQKRIGVVDILAGYQYAMRGERGCNSEWNRYAREGTADWRRLVENDDRDDREGSNMAKYRAPFMRFAPLGWIYQNQLALCRLYDQFSLPTIDPQRRRVYPEVAAHTDPAVAQMSGPFSVFPKLLLPAGSAARKFAHSQTQLDQALIACALERFRLAHGSYSDTLAPLAPAFLEKIPHDLLSGEPLKYRRTDDGLYVLYSIGWNAKDDGGMETKTKDGYPNIESGDWVWRLPSRP